MEHDDELRERRSQKLAEKGFQHIEDEDAEAALAVAAELEHLRYTAAFEIAALAHAQLGRPEVAVATLERGLELAPTVWVNWQLLGNYLSDLKRYEAAARAYDRALGCPGVWQSSIHLNQAILANRQGAPERALGYLEEVTDHELAIRAASIRVHALAQLGRVDEAILFGETTLSEADTDNAEQLAGLAASICYVRRDHDAAREQVFEFALAALDRYDRSNRELLCLIRTLDERRSPAAKYQRLTIDAKIPFTDPQYQETEGYVVTYDVVADTVEEALGFVERMEDPIVRGNLLVEEHEVLVENSPDPKGVYRRSGRHYYVREE